MPCFARIAPTDAVNSERKRPQWLEELIVKHSCMKTVGAAVLVGIWFPMFLISQTTQTPHPHGPYARIAFMRAIDERHSVDLEAGYVRHLEWHRQAKDTFSWYSYSVWASTERQRWIMYATFEHTAAELSNPVSPAEDERDSIINILPNVEFTGNAVYEFLPALSRGSGIPTPARQAEYATVELNYGAGKAFEAALAAEQSNLRAETLWYRLVVGGDPLVYVRLCPRASLAGILDEHPDQALPEKVNGLVSKMTVETLRLRPDMLVNLTPELAH
jgi:hypothetical protein